MSEEMNIEDKKTSRGDLIVLNSVDGLVLDPKKALLGTEKQSMELGELDKDEQPIIYHEPKNGVVSKITAIPSSEDWNLDVLSSLLPLDKVKEIRSLMVPHDPASMDDFHWGDNEDDSFLVASTYKVIQSLKGAGGQENDLWGCIWKATGSERVKFFFWSVANRKIMTTRKEKRTNFSDDADCPFCRGMEESILHCLRDCPNARDVSRMVLPEVEHVLARSATNFIKDTNAVVIKDFKLGATSKKWVRWDPPLGPNIKLNTDASILQDSRHAATGGLLRNNKREWLASFSVNVDISSVIVAKMWGVCEGLRLAKRRGFRAVLEMDSLVLANLLREEVDKEHPLSYFLKERDTMGQNLLFGLHLLCTQTGLIHGLAYMDHLLGPMTGPKFDSCA
ncbi:Reverse transcriptase zinc-binding domain [Dillenia turbinata]|uniref:Reverse transcriptase zinc-binding domain n=1 Tax=Dillenia turbinata TaxID=194707 RepID=A0AAN8VN22_9MAGN